MCADKVSIEDEKRDLTVVGRRQQRPSPPSTAPPRPSKKCRRQRHGHT
ncbi:MAG: hypothetical protein J07HB67_00960, partial [halophilic archaeon J07HB67]